jgi:hypothetical protein
MSDAEAKAVEELLDYIEKEAQAIRGETRQEGDIDKNSYAAAKGITPKQASYILDKLAQLGKLNKVRVYDPDHCQHVNVYRMPRRGP